LLEPLAKVKDFRLDKEVRLLELPIKLYMRISAIRGKKLVKKTKNYLKPSSFKG